MSDETSLPFTRFHLTLHRRGGFAHVDQTTELRWEGGTGTVTARRPGENRSVPVDAARVRALWEQLEAAGFWDCRPGSSALLSRLARLLTGPGAMDAMTTTVSASAVVNGQQRRAGFSVSSPPSGDDARALEALRAIDRFFSGKENAH